MQLNPLVVRPKRQREVPKKQRLKRKRYSSRVLQSSSRFPQPALPTIVEAWFGSDEDLPLTDPTAAATPTDPATSANKVPVQPRFSEEGLVDRTPQEKAKKPGKLRDPIPVSTTQQLMTL